MVFVRICFGDSCCEPDENNEGKCMAEDCFGALFKSRRGGYKTMHDKKLPHPAPGQGKSVPIGGKKTTIH